MTPTAPLEQHYRHTTIAARLDLESPRAVVNWLKAGLFGSDWFKRGNDYYIPSSALARFLENHRPAAPSSLVLRPRGLRRGRSTVSPTT